MVRYWTKLLGTAPQQSIAWREGVPHQCTITPSCCLGCVHCLIAELSVNFDTRVIDGYAQVGVCRAPPLTHWVQARLLQVTKPALLVEPRRSG
jgi:hypothetical protein